MKGNYTFKKIVQRLLHALVAVCILLAVGCADDQLASYSLVGENVKATLHFGATTNDTITITSRATYDYHYESMVRNVYVLVFANGNKIYGRYFGTDDLDNTEEDEYWTVTNVGPNNTPQKTTGTLHLNVPSVSAEAEIVLIANIDLDFLNVSKERLGLVRTKAELQELVVSLNQEIPDRNAGYFMMTGSQEGVSITTDGEIRLPQGSIKLRRLDAKVEVNVRVNPNEVTNSQKVEEFIPESWQVVNLPKSSLLVPTTTSLDLPKDSYFDIGPKNFETTENEMVNGTATGGVLHGFSFYTLENKRSSNLKKSVGGNYHNRDRRIKNTDGSYNTENGLWEYAPELATYMIIKGELKMLVDPGLTSEQHLIADVTYYVHLGDFVYNKDNYDVLRNTHYKYTINVKGVENIEVEVETSNDNQTGITENHLDWHADFSEYVNAKRNILLSRGVRVLSADRPLPDGFEEDGVTAYFSTEKNKKDLFSRYGDATLAYLDGGFVCIRENGSEKRLFPVSDFALPADYDRKNLFAAILLSLPFATENGIHTAAKTAKALPHRMEKVACIGGVTYYDSSIDSSPARTAASLSALPFSPIVIMGGKNKGLSYEALPDLLAKRAKAVILTGENADDLQHALNQSRAFRESGVGLFLEDSLSSAVFRASKLAKAGDAVVLSPAATSFDRYKNYAARGEAFRSAVLSLTK